jgi:hypothetical protein
LNEIRLKSIFQLSSHMKSSKFMARGLVTERIFSLVCSDFSFLFDTFFNVSHSQGFSLL